MMKPIAIKFQHIFFDSISSEIKDDDLLDRIRVYNEDDLRVLMVIKEWIVKGSF